VRPRDGPEFALGSPERSAPARHDEPFEKALGRAIRHLGGRYSEYLALITTVREYAHAHDLDLRQAARALANQP